MRNIWKKTIAGISRMEIPAMCFLREMYGTARQRSAAREEAGASSYQPDVLRKGSSHRQLSQATFACAARP